MRSFAPLTFFGLRVATGAALCVSATFAQVQVQVQGVFFEALNEERQAGCEGRPGVRAPLQAQSRLGEAARALAEGRSLEAALASSNYRAMRASQITLRGYSDPEAMARGVARHSCAALLNPTLTQAGVHVRGDAMWLVLAAPFLPPSPEQGAQVRAQVLQLVNEARRQPRRCGTKLMAAARPLELDETLNAVAAGHAADMARHSYFSHTARDGSQAAQRASRAGYAWRSVGENLAAGQLDAADAVQGWLQSPGHCVNVMAPQFTQMGLAFAVNPKSEAGIYWVQVLGLPQ